MELPCGSCSSVDRVGRLRAKTSERVCRVVHGSWYPRHYYLSSHGGSSKLLHGLQGSTGHKTASTDIGQVAQPGQGQTHQEPHSSHLLCRLARIWAKGFSIAIFKKRSSFIATDGAVGKPNAMEPVVVALLHKIFSVFFNHPRVKRRFNHTIELLSRNQPPYPQLYLYSSGDRVLPVQIVKDFVEEQKRCGRQVDSHDFVWSPHVGHLRCQPDLYTNLLTRFLNNCLCSTSTH